MKMAGSTVAQELWDASCFSCVSVGVGTGTTLWAHRSFSWRSGRAPSEGLLPHLGQVGCVTGSARTSAGAWLLASLPAATVEGE